MGMMVLLGFGCTCSEAGRQLLLGLPTRAALGFDVAARTSRLACTRNFCNVDIRFYILSPELVYALGISGSAAVGLPCPGRREHHRPPASHWWRGGGLSGVGHGDAQL